MDAPHATEVCLNAAEQDAMDAITRCHRLILEDLGLQTNHGEIAFAIHILQGAIIQHMLARLAPAQWSNWYRDIDGETS